MQLGALPFNQLASSSSACTYAAGNAQLLQFSQPPSFIGASPTILESTAYPSIVSQSYPVYDASIAFQGVQGNLQALPVLQSFSSFPPSSWPPSQIISSPPAIVAAPVMAVQTLSQPALSSVDSACIRGRTVVFLDVDGVLHSNSAPMNMKFAPNCMQALARIIQTTGADIVLSSTWRVSEGSIAQVNANLSRHGMPAVIGCTKMLSTPREEEVCQWLDEHSGEVARWIAIDDIDLAQNNVLCEAAKRMQDHFVHTDPNTGLTEADASMAIALITKQ